MSLTDAITDAAALSPPITDHEAIRDWLGEEAGDPVPVDRTLSAGELARMVGPIRMEQILTAAEGSSVVGAKAVVRLLEAGEPLPLAAPGVADLLTAMVTAEILDEVEAVAVGALARRQPRRFESYGLASAPSGARVAETIAQAGGGGS